MKALYTGSLIWLKTVFLNAFLFALGAVFVGKWSYAVGSFFIFIVGFVGTLPLLLIIVPLVRISSLIPYSTSARIGWLFF